MHKLSTTTVALMALPALLAAALPAAAAEFITTNRTVAGGNPLNGNYIGQQVIVGLTAAQQPVLNVQVDVVAPALFSYSDQTGGGIRAASNSVVRIQGGTFNQITGTGFGGGLELNDAATGAISGGTLRHLSVAGAAAGVAGARATVSGGLIENGVAGVAAVNNGTLHVSGGTLRSTGNGQSAIAGGAGSVIQVSGGLLQSTTGAAIYIAQNSSLAITGGTVTGGASGGGQWGVRMEGANLMGQFSGGTINGGVRADAYSFQTALQATLGGSLAVNGGVFAYNNAAVNVTGGSYTDFAGAAPSASFLAMGSNTINFFGSGLALSGPTAGSVFETNNYVGNFYTFTSGVFADGQSAVGLRLFDATSVANNPLLGGFTLNAVAAVPEPATWLMMMLALPALGAVVRQRRLV